MKYSLLIGVFFAFSCGVAEVDLPESRTQSHSQNIDAAPVGTREAVTVDIIPIPKCSPSVCMSVKTGCESVSKVQAGATCVCDPSWTCPFKYECVNGTTCEPGPEGAGQILRPKYYIPLDVEGPCTWCGGSTITMWQCLVCGGKVVGESCANVMPSLSCYAE